MSKEKPWESDTDDEGWSPEKRMEVAKDVIGKCRRMGLWVCLNGDKNVALAGSQEALNKLSDRDKGLLKRVERELATLVSDRRIDGPLGSRCVVFLDDMKFHATNRGETYTFKAGDIRVVEAGLAEALVNTPSACYHPGPSENYA